MSAAGGKEILVVNLTRMGDLIQTTPVMAGIKDAYPGARITLLANAVFAEICKDIPFADRIVVFDKMGLRKLVCDEEHSVVEGYRALETFIDEVNDTEYDLAINFTASGEGAVLTSLFNAREVRGVTADSEGCRIIRYPWQWYFMSVIPSRNYNPFHLCDMFVKAGGVSTSRKGLHLNVSDEERLKCKAVLGGYGIGDDDPVIGFQLGASHRLKTWPAASFAGLADRLAESLGARILLTGSKSEEQLGREFESLSATKAVNLIGKTDLRGVAALLERCALFVSNDTGPLHIATAVGTRALDISLGHVCFRETGPYGEGHYVIEADVPCGPCGFHVECKNPRCKEMVTSESVFDLARRILREGGVESIEDGPLWRGVRVYRSGFPEDGLADYTPLIRRPLTRETFYVYLYRETWQRILGGGGGASAGQAGEGLVSKIAAWHGDEALDTLRGALRDDLEIARNMEALAGEALTRVSLIAREAVRPAPDAEWIRRTWEDVPAVDREIETLGRTHPHLMPPVTLFRFGKEALEGKELAVLAESALRLYSDLKNHYAMIAEAIGGLVEKRVIAPIASCNT
ncbi:MAG: glycosyltransferase family 9 protein [Deltaproteobacteria bacterium]|nr:glycosyltransferase family 9 protein [Deltaproteobacteria bacterium]